MTIGKRLSGCALLGFGLLTLCSLVRAAPGISVSNPYPAVGDLVETNLTGELPNQPTDIYLYLKNLTNGTVNYYYEKQIRIPQAPAKPWRSSVSGPKWPETNPVFSFRGTVVGPHVVGLKLQPAGTAFSPAGAIEASFGVGLLAPPVLAPPPVQPATSPTATPASTAVPQKTAPANIPSTAATPATPASTTATPSKPTATPVATTMPVPTVAAQQPLVTTSIATPTAPTLVATAQPPAKPAASGSATPVVIGGGASGASGGASSGGPPNGSNAGTTNSNSGGGSTSSGSSTPSGGAAVPETSTVGTGTGAGTSTGTGNQGTGSRTTPSTAPSVIFHTSPPSPQAHPEAIDLSQLMDNADFAWFFDWVAEEQGRGTWADFSAWWRKHWLADTGKKRTMNIMCDRLLDDLRISCAVWTTWTDFPEQQPNDRVSMLFSRISPDQQKPKPKQCDLGTSCCLDGKLLAENQTGNPSSKTLNDKYAYKQCIKQKLVSVYDNIDDYNNEYKRRARYEFQITPQGGTNSCLCATIANLHRKLEPKDAGVTYQNIIDTFFKARGTTCIQQNFEYAFATYAKVYGEPGSVFGNDALVQSRLWPAYVSQKFQTVDQILSTIDEALDEGQLVAMGLDARPIWRYFYFQKDANKLPSGSNDVPRYPDSKGEGALIVDVMNPSYEDNMHAVMIVGLERSSNGALTKYWIGDGGVVTDSGAIYSVTRAVLKAAFIPSWVLGGGVYIPDLSVFPNQIYKPQ